MTALMPVMRTAVQPSLTNPLFAIPTEPTIVATERRADDVEVTDFRYSCGGPAHLPDIRAGN